MTQRLPSSGRSFYVVAALGLVTAFGWLMLRSADAQVPKAHPMKSETVKVYLRDVPANSPPFLEGSVHTFNEQWIILRTTRPGSPPNAIWIPQSSVHYVEAKVNVVPPA